MTEVDEPYESPRRRLRRGVAAAITIACFAVIGGALALAVIEMRFRIEQRDRICQVAVTSRVGERAMWEWLIPAAAAGGSPLAAEGARQLDLRLPRLRCINGVAVPVDEHGEPLPLDDEGQPLID